MILRLNLNKNKSSEQMFTYEQMFTTYQANANETQSQQGVGAVAGEA